MVSPAAALVIQGPAWVKDSGKRTARGAVVWRAANGPKPDPSYLTPAEAADRLQTMLAAAPRAATRRRAAGPRFAAVAAEWLEHGERKRGLKHSTLKDYRYLINTHLLPAFGELEVDPRGSLLRFVHCPSAAKPLR